MGAGTGLETGAGASHLTPVAWAFRQRIFAWLVAIAMVPAGISVLAVALAPRVAEPVGGADAWERAATSWRSIRYGIDQVTLPPGLDRAVARHEAELTTSLQRSRQAEAIRHAFGGLLAATAIALAVLVGGGAVRLAGHLSRQLSRPIDELVQWTGLLQSGEPLPDTPPARGAPEFEVLRTAFRRMAGELERARAREVEAAELRAFRDLARQVAHEIKNPLTPMRFAIARLARDATPEAQELITVLDTESARLARMAKDFGDLGRLPEGPPSLVDLGELCDGLALGSAPDGVTVRSEHEDPVVVLGHLEPLRRAVQNLLLNAIDAVMPAGGEVVLRAEPDGAGGRVHVIDSGPGIAGDVLPRVFEPYFTTKSGGTGLGLALVRQTVHLHGGAIEVQSAPGRTAFTISLPGHA